MADYPDVFTDGMTVTVNPVGITLTFTRSEPAIPNVNDTARDEPICRVRCSREFAVMLRDTLTQALAGQPGTQTVSH